MRALVLCVLATLALTPAGFGADIAYLSSYNDTSVFGNTGHHVQQLTLLSIEAGALALYDVLVVGHLADQHWSSLACQKVESFLASGGGIVAEWNTSMVVFSSIDQNALGLVQPPCSFFPGHTSGGGLVDTDTPLYHTTAAGELTAGLPNPIRLGGGSEFFYRITGIGSPWTIEAQYQSTNNQWYPALLRAPYGAGCITVAAFDLFDALPSNGQASTLFDNLIDSALDCQSEPPPILLEGFESGEAAGWETFP